MSVSLNAKTKQHTSKDFYDRKISSTNNETTKLILHSLISVLNISQKQ